MTKLLNYYPVRKRRKVRDIKITIVVNVLAPLKKTFCFALLVLS